MFFRAAKFNTFIPYSIPYTIFFITAPFTWICACYSIFVIGKLIRSNPAASEDGRQVRLEKLSYMVVLIGGCVQVANISIALTQYSMLSIAMISATLLLFTIAELLVELNKKMYNPLAEPTGMSYFASSL